jgi:hypothetical protein
MTESHSIYLMVEAYSRKVLSNIAIALNSDSDSTRYETTHKGHERLKQEQRRKKITDKEKDIVCIPQEQKTS